MSIKLSHDILEPYTINGTIITTLTNSGYLMYTLNMLKSLKPYGLDKKIFITCIDKKGSEGLKKMGYDSYCVDETVGNPLGKFCPWNSTDYVKICYYKLELIYNILLYRNVLLIDGDIVFKKDPIDDLKQWCDDTIFDVFCQNDSLNNSNTRNMCTGYMFIKKSDRLLKLYDCVSEVGRSKYLKCAFDNNDQTYFNVYVKPYCVFNALPLEKYPNGKMFYDNPTLDPVLVHFNWVQGHLKMAKMKEHGMWLLTD
jgi:hypothetical protein